MNVAAKCALLKSVTMLCKNNFMTSQWPQWPLTFVYDLSSLHHFYPVRHLCLSLIIILIGLQVDDCSTLEEIPPTHSWDITFTRMGRTYGQVGRRMDNMKNNITGRKPSVPQRHMKNIALVQFYILHVHCVEAWRESLKLRHITVYTILTNSTEKWGERRTVLQDKKPLFTVLKSEQSNAEHIVSKNKGAACVMKIGGIKHHQFGKTPEGHPAGFVKLNQLINNGL